VDCLERIQCLSAADNEHFWRHRIEKVTDLAQHSDGHGLERFLSFFDGMGSFSDLAIRGSDEAASSLRTEPSRSYTIGQELLQ
jgi:hypothetical protein